MVAMDRKSVSFMFSYPNLIPLSTNKVQTIVETLDDIKFDRIYSAWWRCEIREHAKEITEMSANKYIHAISE